LKRRQQPKKNGVDLQDRVERVFEKIVTPTKTGVLNISPLEIIASGLTIGLLLWFHDAAISSKVPLLIPPFAGSIGVLYTQPGMTQARSWNVIAGQFFGGLAGFICASIFTGSLPLAAGFAIGLALLFQRSTHSLHPPALATALIVVIIPESHGVRYLFFPILLGAVIIVVIAWIVHLFRSRHWHTSKEWCLLLGWLQRQAQVKKFCNPRTTRILGVFPPLWRVTCR